MSNWTVEEQKAYYKEYWKRPEVKKRRNERRTDRTSWVEYLCWIKRSYSISELEYLTLLWKTKGRCFNPACRKLGVDLPQGLAVDHSHQTGLVRGLLCSNCNIALGQLKEDMTLIDGLNRYIKDFSYE